MTDLGNLTGMLEKASIPFYENKYETSTIDEHGWVRAEEIEIEFGCGAEDAYVQFIFTPEGDIKDVYYGIRYE